MNTHETENDKPIMDEATYDSYFEEGSDNQEGYDVDYYEEEESFLDQIKDKIVYAFGVLLLIAMINEYNTFTHNKKKICGKAPHMSTSQCMKSVWRAHRFFE